MGEYVYLTPDLHEGLRYYILYFYCNANHEGKKPKELKLREKRKIIGGNRETKLGKIGCPWNFFLWK